MFDDTIGKSLVKSIDDVTLRGVHLLLVLENGEVVTFGLEREGTPLYLPRGGVFYVTFIACGHVNY